MKRTLAFIISAALALSLCGCGKPDVKKAETTVEKAAEKTVKTLPKKFDKSPTIESTVIYDENGIRITADKLTYSNFSAEIKLIFENNSDKNLSFVSGSNGYCVNSVNGYMTGGGYVNCDVDAGQTAEDKISFDFKSLNLLGISKIADVELGFDISDEESDSIETGPLQIKTNIADKYDYSENTYLAALEDGTLENKLGIKINSISKEVLYDDYEIKVPSAAVVTNEDNETWLMLEVDNNSDSEIEAGIKDICFGNLTVYDSMWSSESITGNKKCIMLISLSRLAEEYEDDEEGEKITDISELSMTFCIGVEAYDPYDSKEITISLPKIKLQKNNDEDE